MNITRIFYFIITVVLGIVFYAQYQLSTRLENLNNSIQNLYLTNNKDLKQINNLIFESHFKDDLILNNFNTSTTIIIAFFTALIALGAVFSFKKIDEDIKELKESATTIEETANEVKEAKSKIEETANEVKEAKSKIEETANDIEATELKLIYLNIRSLQEDTAIYSTTITQYCSEKINSTFDAYPIFSNLSNSYFKLVYISTLIDMYKIDDPDITEPMDNQYNQTIKNIQAFQKTLINFIKNNKTYFTERNILVFNLWFETFEKHCKINDFTELKDQYYEIVSTINQYKEEQGISL